MEGAVPANRNAPHLAVQLPFGMVGAEPISQHLLVSYTETYAIQLLHQNLPPWWQRNGKPVGTMLDEAEHDYATLEKRGETFDADLTRDLTRVGSEHYAWLCTLAYRQSIAAPQARRRPRRPTHALRQGKLLQWRHGHRRRPLPLRPHLPLL